MIEKLKLHRLQLMKWCGAHTTEDKLTVDLIFSFILFIIYPLLGTLYLLFAITIIEDDDPL